MKYIISVLMLIMADLSYAGYAEVGFEIEDNNEEYSRADLFSPYLATEFSPENIPLSFGVKFQNFQRDEYLKDSSGNSTGQRANKERQDYWMYTNYKATDDLTLVPMLRLRKEQVPQEDTRQTQYRFYPKAVYKINDTISLRTDGYVALVDNHTKARGEDKKAGLSTKRYDYTDYKHELEFQVDFKIDDIQSARVSMYNAYDKFDGTSVDGRDTESVDEWQARLLYTRKVTDDLLVNVFARWDVDRKYKRSDGETKKNMRDRFGISGAYSINDELSLRFEYYHQPEDNQDWSTNGVEGAYNTAQDKNFYKFGLRYNF